LLVSSGKHKGFRGSIHGHEEAVHTVSLEQLISRLSSPLVRIHHFQELEATGLCEHNGTQPNRKHRPKPPSEQIPVPRRVLGIFGESIESCLFSRLEQEPSYQTNQCPYQRVFSQLVLFGQVQISESNHQHLFTLLKDEFEDHCFTEFLQGFLVLRMNKLNLLLLTVFRVGLGVNSTKPKYTGSVVDSFFVYIFKSFGAIHVFPVGRLIRINSQV